MVVSIEEIKKKIENGEKNLYFWSKMINSRPYFTLYSCSSKIRKLETRVPKELQSC